MIECAGKKKYFYKIVLINSPMENMLRKLNSGAKNRLRFEE